MDDSTRSAALAKADAMISLTGAPNTAPPIAHLRFDAAKWTGTSSAVARETLQLTMSQAGRPVDRLHVQRNGRDLESLEYLGHVKCCCSGLCLRAG